MVDGLKVEAHVDVRHPRLSARFMLIDHVDRMDTHLASAVIQVDQKVDENGGWPLELLLANGTVAEVYTQPGEVILYEGAWLRHGRPMRLRGDEFANLFSHFSPLDWDGPRGADSKNRYDGVPADRLTTLPDLNPNPNPNPNPEPEPEPEP